MMTFLGLKCVGVITEDVMFYWFKYHFRSARTCVYNSIHVNVYLHSVSGLQETRNFIIFGLIWFPPQWNSYWEGFRSGMLMYMYAKWT